MSTIDFRKVVPAGTRPAVGLALTVVAGLLAAAFQAAAHREERNHRTLAVQFGAERACRTPQAIRFG